MRVAPRRGHRQGTCGRRHRNHPARWISRSAD